MADSQQGWKMEDADAPATTAPVHVVNGWKMEDADAAPAAAQPVSTPHGTMTPPGPARPPLPPGLMASPPSDAPEWIKGMYEAKFGMPAPASLGTAFREPAEQMLGGAAKIAGAQNPRDVAGGASEAIKGAVGAYSGPEVMGPMLAGAPIGATGTLVAAGATQKGTNAGLKAMGVPEEYAGLASDVAGLLVGAGGAHLLVAKAYKALGSPEVKLGAGKFAEPKEFRDMTDEELVQHANKIDQDRPKNYEWQRGEIAKEALTRQAGRGMGPGDPQAAPAPAPPVDLGKGWKVGADVFDHDPVGEAQEKWIRSQEQAEIARRDPPPEPQVAAEAQPQPPEPQPQQPVTVPVPQQQTVAEKPQQANTLTPQGVPTEGTPPPEDTALLDAIAGKPFAKLTPAEKEQTRAIAARLDQPVPEAHQEAPAEPGQGWRTARPEEAAPPPAPAPPAERAQVREQFNAAPEARAAVPEPAPIEFGKGWSMAPAESRPAVPESKAAPQQAPAAEPAAEIQPAGPPKPGSYANVAPSSLTLDPNRFQFKFEGIGHQGVSDQFKNVEKWNDKLGGTLAVWYDPANGKTYPVNGHHRTQLGQRLGDENVPNGMHVYYLDAKDAKDARAQGALINIGEGNGTALDVAKFMRDTGHTAASMQQQEGISLTRKEGIQGAALSNLAEPIFHDAVHGILPVERAAVLGAGLPNQADQTNIYQMMKDREASGKRMTNDQVEELIRMNQNAPVVERTSEDDGQGDMFGGHNWAESVLPEKAIVSEYIRKQLSAEKKLFGVVSTQAAAERLGEKGNVIQASTNAQTSEAANQGSVLYDKQSTLTGGPIDAALNRAAQRVAKPEKGDSANAAKQDAYREIRDYLKGQVDKLTGATSGHIAQPEAVREGRDSGAVRPHNPLDAPGVSGDDARAAEALPAEVKPLQAAVEKHAAVVAESKAKLTPAEHNARAAELRAAAKAKAKEPDSLQARKLPPAPLPNHSLFSDEEHELSHAETHSHDDKLLGEQLTAQMKSGGAFKESKLKPAETRSLFDDGPEQDSLFSKRIGGPAYRAGLPDSQLLAEAKVQHSTAGPDQHPVLLVNAQAMELLGADPQSAVGSTYSHGSALRMISELNAYGRENPEAAAIAKQLAQAIERAAPDGGRLIVAQAGAGITPAETRSAVNEELDHGTQLEATGQRFANHIDTAKLFATEEGNRAAYAVRRSYPEVSDAEVALEVGVRLMRPGRYKELDLTAEQALTLAERYVDLLEEQHGPNVAKVVEQTYNAFGKTAQTNLSARRGIRKADFAKSATRQEGPRSPANSRAPDGDLLTGVGPLQARKPSTGLSAKNAKDKETGDNVRTWFTGRRDLWGARVNQRLAGLRKVLPDPIDQEALAIYRDFKGKPGQLAQWLAGTHPAYGEVNRIDHARENIEKLRVPIERAMNPSDAMKEADHALTTIAAASLAEGQRLGFIDKHVKPEEYVTHLLSYEDEDTKEPSTPEQQGRALGGKIGKNFPYNQQRNFPTLLDAAANNYRPRTLNAFAAFQTYGDKFATARATHMLIEQVVDSKLGIFGTQGDKNIPQGWKEIAPHAHPFRNLIAYNDAEGNPKAAYETLFVPPVIEEALRPITDPDYTNKIAGFTKLRVFQGYTKAAQLSLSYFHATSENYMALANMGPSGWLKALKADRYSPEFLEQERDFIKNGGTTSIQGNVYEAYSSVPVSSLPTWQESWKSMPGVRHVDAIAKQITEFTFGKMQRQFKVTDFAIHKAAWLASNPHSTPAEQNTAMRSIAGEVNSVYGGLHWENLGVNKMSVQVARAILLAPDWTLSNIANVHTAFTKTAGGKLARMFWLRAMVGGMIATQAMSLLLSRHPSKRPTQVYMGLDRDGKEVYQNIFFKGAPGDMANLISNVKDYGALFGLTKTAGGKAGPVVRTGIQAITVKNFFGRAIVPKGMNPIAGTVRGGYELGKDLLPLPWSITNMEEMLFGPERHKYKIPLEVLTTLFAGTPPTHVPDKRAPKDSLGIWDQITTGKVSATTPRGSPEEKLRREQQRLMR